METKLTRKPYLVSYKFNASRENIYEYTLDFFGYFQAEHYEQKIRKSLDTLPEFYMLYPECRYLATKNRMYRNIIIDSHLIIYRITNVCIEVLDIIHSASSINKIKNTRRIHI